MFWRGETFPNDSEKRPEKVLIYLFMAIEPTRTTIWQSNQNNTVVVVLFVCSYDGNYYQNNNKNNNNKKNNIIAVANITEYVV